MAHDLGTPTMNCFRNGSVIQLRSKVATQNRCLRILGNMDTDCFGRPGYYADELVPRTRVCARYTNGLYYKGSVKSIDSTRVYVDLDNGNVVSHPKNDRTAMVPDVNVDNTMAVQVSSHIIGMKNPKCTCYHPGIVYDIDRKDRSNFKYHVYYYDQGTGILTLNELRPLPLEHPWRSFACMLHPGCPVFAEKCSGQYFPGIVHHVDSKINVEFENGDFVEHGRSHNHAVVPDTIPDQNAVVIGSKVIARYPAQPYFLPGQVTNLDEGDPYERKFFVQFTNNQSAWVFIHQLRIFYSFKDEVGSKVMALLSNGNYLPGITNSVMGDSVQVRLSDGNMVGYELSDNRAVVVDAPALPHQLKPDTRVVAYNAGAKTFAPGVVKEINFSNPFNITCHVNHDNGAKSWSSIKQIRVIPPHCKVKPGAKVICRWQAEYEKHFPGTVFKVDNKIHVKLNDGRLQTHDYSDVTAVFPDYVPEVSQVHPWSYVVAQVPGKPFYFWGFVTNVDGSNTKNPKFFVKYDGNVPARWCELSDLRLIGSLSPQEESQYIVRSLGGHNMVGLNSVSNKSIYLGMEGGVLRGKAFDPSCQFYIEETADHYVKLHSATQHGCYVHTNAEGRVSVIPGHEGGYGFMFEVKLLFSPYQQMYIPNHTPSPQMTSYTAPNPYASLVQSLGPEADVHGASHGYNFVPGMSNLAHTLAKTMNAQGQTTVNAPPPMYNNNPPPMYSNTPPPMFNNTPPPMFNNAPPPPYVAGNAHQETFGACHK